MTVPALLKEITQLLADAGVDTPKGDAQELLIAILNIRHTILFHQSGEISDEACEAVRRAARRRAAGEPLQYVLGHWYFMRRKYTVGEGVLIPRDDTEVVVREAITFAKSCRDPVIVDLCAGSGIIAITLEKELEHATVYAVEKSEKAFCYLQENIALHQANVKAIHADLRDCVGDFMDGSIDMIVSNPPYIPSDEIATLQREIQYEPRLALDGGKDGCDFYETIIALWTKKLKKGGCIAFEIGEGQFSYIAELLKTAGFTDIKGAPDIQGITRALTAVI